jgi:galactokinase
MGAGERAQDIFRARFGRVPSWIASAPGRVNLIGEFTDYNEGFVLPMAIEFRTAIAAAPNESNAIVLRSEAAAETAVIDLTRPLPPDPKGCWSNYPKGVLAGFIAAGLLPRGFDAVIYSDVPMGAGVSSSAALACSMATLLEAVCDVQMNPDAKVLLCQRAEHSYAQVPCGIMDPFISMLAREGQVLLLDCRSRQAVWLPFQDQLVTVLLINTNVKHQLAASAYAKRRQECEAAARTLGVRSLRDASLQALERGSGLDAVLRRRARHVVGEITRTARAAQCIRERDWVQLGQLLDASHASLKGDFEVSCAELDAVVDIAHGLGPRGGVFGCRMTGGGFGGCVVALIATALQEAIVQEIAAEYQKRTGIAATSFVSRPAAGAGLLRPGTVG